MHILFFPSWYPESEEDFSGSFFREQAEAFVAEGHVAGVITVRGFPVYQYGAYRSRKIETYRVERGIVTLRDDAILPVPKLHALNLSALEQRWRRLYKLYVSEHGRPDVINAHAMFPAGIIASRIARSEQIPFVVTEHRPSSVDFLRSPGYAGAARSAAREASALVAVARGFVPVLDEAYGLSKWQYLPGLLSPQFEDVSVREPAEAPFVFGHVSHLDPGKRVDLLIEAFGDAFGSDPTTRLRIAGGSEHRAALESITEERQLTNVEFVGAVPRQQIVEEFSRSHVFALPSEAEAFGTVLWEAMACGLPLLSTATWAGHNAVTAETGILTPINDRQALAGALQDIRKRFNDFDSARIREVCVEHCGRRAFVSNYVKLYQRH